MKKLFLGLGLFAGSLAFAQFSEANFGVKAGGNASTLTPNGSSIKESVKNNYKFDFYAGVFARIPVSNRFTLQPELLYDRLGTKSKETVDGITKSYTQRLNYLTIPVMVQYNFSPKFYVEIGPQASLFLDGKGVRKVSGSNTSESNSNKTDRNEVNNFVFGAAAGLGYYFTPQIGVNLRYVAGINGTQRNSNRDNAIRSNSFQLGLMFRLANKKDKTQTTSTKTEAIEVVEVVEEATK
ncbi:MAG: PorT family protein [Bergeyella sp.]|nr:PorT family protein [Bergeyella sp.]